ncbi:hypothetical protein GV827_16835 [Sulfitobacter sp. JBTF-M27]|uniref:Uncharacterized protein n=1 Tax=Sulfitobacter sediminilitoris TaxID=2698830 RepID=A0A6P0CFN6_9RHOB|nr:hypothetical protein [Sulfitobacter sediminilitoris]NEK24058.1 hypothetical protein [Sulfitobacter sediminilitoris]
MFTTFPLLVAVGVGSRLALSLALRRRYGLSLEVPQVLAVGLIVLAALPAWLTPVSLPVPLGLVLGAVLPDLLLRRA